WYKPSSTLPQLVARFQQHPQRSCSRSIEIWTTTCIVTNFGMQRHRNSHAASKDNDDPHPTLSHLPRCSTMINPANPFLTGPHSFPYFPKGGPQPKNPPNRTAHHIMGYVSQWGGMDVGSGMLFPAAVIDGLIHQLGGKYLRMECSCLPNHSFSHAYHNQQTVPEEWSGIDSAVEILKNSDRKHVKCPVGTAVITSSGGEQLRAEYDKIVHTVPPFYNYPPTATSEMKQLLGIDAESVDPESWSYELLRSCYRHSFRLAFGCNQSNDDKSKGTLCNLLESIGITNQVSVPENQRVSVPLLGAGCRGFPASVAIEAAVAESVSWLSSSNNECLHDDSTSTAKSARKREPVVAFGLLETSDAEVLATKLRESLQIHH
ncbi:hypothetical protein HJC23_006256, partial [Cyclotella cryptica]